MSSILVLGCQNILKQYSTCFRPVTLANTRLCLNGFKHKVGGINLTMRMWIGDAHGFAFVLKDQDVLDLWTTPKILLLLLPNLEQVLDLNWLELAKCQVVLRAVAYDARDTTGRPVAVDPRWWIQFKRRIRRNTGMIIIEDKGL